MTLNEIVVAALTQEERGQDAQVVEKYNDKFRQYANEAVLDLAKSMRVYRTDTVTAENNVFDLSQLSRSCAKILSVTQGGKSVTFDTGDASGEVLVGCDGLVRVKYEYIPPELASDTDSPDLPEHFHPLIVMYVLARYRSSGDASAQGGSGVYFQLYNQYKRSLVQRIGTPGQYALTNIY